jgi:PLP dependent protein
MPISAEQYEEIVKELAASHVTLVAVSKTKPVEDIEALFNKGQVDFGENYVQELAEKHPMLSPHVRWHFIGHLQTNKVKQVVPYVHMIHSVDSLKLLKEINKEAAKAGKMVDCLLQMYIAKEETKYGLDEAELNEILDNVHSLNSIRLRGLMGMASLTDDTEQVRMEYRDLKQLYSKLVQERPECSTFRVLSMGMSSDYKIAIEEGSTMVRIGSLIFGERNYTQ